MFWRCGKESNLRLLSCGQAPEPLGHRIKSEILLALFDVWTVVEFVYLVSMPRNAETRERTMEPRMAVIKESMSKPGVMAAAAISRTMLRMRAKSPRERIVMGRVMSWRMGLIKVLMIPMTTAAIMAAWRLTTVKPGIR